MDSPSCAPIRELLIKTCHKRGAHAMGGMAAQIPISGDDPAANAAVWPRCAPTRSVKPAPATTAPGSPIPADSRWRCEVFDAHMPEANQVHIGAREDVHAERADLLRPAGHDHRGRLRNNIEVCVRYLAAWLDGNGCVPIHWLMEDAATAEISAPSCGSGCTSPTTATSRCDDGTPLDFALFERVLGLSKVELRMPGASRINEAIADARPADDPCR
jgi:malate synthase